jgi:hypothetical protein
LVYTWAFTYPEINRTVMAIMRNFFIVIRIY